MADIDSILAGIGGNTRADFSGIGDLPKAYWEGLDQKAKNDLRNAFKPTADNPNGVPMKDGQIDIPTVAKTFFQKGDIAGGTALLGTAQAAQDRTDYLKSLEHQGTAQQPKIVTPPSASAPRLKEVAAPLNKGGVQAPQGQPRTSPQGDQPGSIVGLLSDAGISDELKGPFINQLSAKFKTDPNASLDPQTSARVQEVIKAAAQRMKAGQQGAPQTPPPQMAPQMAPQQPPQQAPMQAPMQAPQGFQPSPAQVAAQNDPELKRAKYFAASRDKEIAASALAEQKAIQESRQPTNQMKEARDSGLTLQQYQERQGEQAAQQAGSTERAKNEVVEQKTWIDQGRQAQTRLGTLNLMTNIIQSDKNLNLGFGSQTSLKIKMALERIGVDTGDLSGAQLLGKYNSILAAESTKGVTSRGTNFDMKTFIANNPGLGMDEKGNIRMLGILSQNAKREYELGKLARQTQDNWDKWDDVVEKYDRNNPIKDPTTGKVLSNSSVIAPAPKQETQQAKQGPSSIPTFALKADRDAAIASGKLKKGDSFIGGDGVERFVP